MAEAWFAWILTFDIHVESTTSMWLDIWPAYRIWS